MASGDVGAAGCCVAKTPPATPCGEKRHSSLPGSRKPPSRLALRCTQSRRRPRTRATWAVLSRPISPPGVRAAARSRSTSCSGDPATAIGVLLSAAAPVRPPGAVPAGRPRRRMAEGCGRTFAAVIAVDRGLGHPMGRTPRQIAQLPAESRRRRSARFWFLPANRPLFSRFVRASHARGRRFETRRAHDEEIAGNEKVCGRAPSAAADPKVARWPKPHRRRIVIAVRTPRFQRLRRRARSPTGGASGSSWATMSAARPTRAAHPTPLTLVTRTRVAR